jgi:hypothetical protein
MVEPSNFNELYSDSKDILTNFGELSVVCKHTLHIHRFNLDKVKKLSKYKDMLDKAKNTIQEQLDSIQNSFDTLETNLIIYFHNQKRTQTELLYLAELQEKEINQNKANNEDDMKNLLNQKIDNTNDFDLDIKKKSKKLNKTDVKTDVQEEIKVASEYIERF